MTCCGQHRAKNGKLLPPVDVPFTVAPSEPCVMCAEKHLSTAYALMMESGYETPNRQRIIGELVGAQWHLYRTHFNLAASIRAARHLIQMRQESQVEWNKLLTEMDALARKEAQQYEQSRLDQGRAGTETA